MANFDQIINPLAETQHGVVSRQQLRDAGVGAGAISSRMKRGGLVSLSKRVLRVAGSPETDLARCMAGVLDAGPDAVLSHRSAGWFWGAAGFLIDDIDVIGSRGSVRLSSDRLALVHRPRQLLVGHTVVISGIPVTTPTRTIFDLAGLPGVHAAKVERALDGLWARGRLDADSCAAVLEAVAVRGRPGITLMRSLLAERGKGYRPPESNAEARFQAIVRDARLGSFERQVDVGTELHWIGRVDFADRDRRIVVEVDPALHHGSFSAQSDDRQRHETLRAAGWCVVSVTDTDLFHRRSAVVAQIRDAVNASNGRSGARRSA